MIARIWHGWTPADKAGTYAEYVRETGVREQTSLPGNRGTFVLRRIEGDRAHFIVLSLWDSMDAVRRFSSDPEKPIYYPRDAEYLLELTPDIEHYETVVAPSGR
jgi:heme-degrading monooxygenase HmoA